MPNHVRLEVDGRVKIEGEFEKVTLSEDLSTGAFTVQGGPAGVRATAGNGLGSAIGAGLPALAERLKANSREAADRARVAAKAAEDAKAAEEAKADSPNA